MKEQFTLSYLRGSLWLAGNKSRGTIAGLWLVWKIAYSLGYFIWRGQEEQWQDYKGAAPWIKLMFIAWPAYMSMVSHFSRKQSCLPFQSMITWHKNKELIGGESKRSLAIGCYQVERVRELRVTCCHAIRAGIRWETRGSDHCYQPCSGGASIFNIFMCDGQSGPFRLHPIQMNTAAEVLDHALKLLLFHVRMFWERGR